VRIYEGVREQTWEDLRRDLGRD